VNTITLTPIGVVRSPEKESRKGRFDQVEAEIVIDQELAEGLEGLEEFSHLEVIFALHLPEPTIERDQLGLKVHPRGHREIPAVGLFATRSPNRPNRIGLTLCQILGIEGNVIRVRGLDALDGSPVLDLKAPSLSSAETFGEMRFAGWMYQLRERDRRGEW
jgi:tRNA-Thr(GGU) m(6)t(6)A37 methyltransferase TsaA